MKATEKTIRIYSDKRYFIIKTYSLDDAIRRFRAMFPKKVILFAHDTKFTKITNKFNPHLKQFKHESEIQY